MAGKPSFWPMPPPILYSHEIFRTSRYGGKHPLAIPRVSTAVDLAGALGWLPPDRHRISPQATPEQLTRFHDPAYIEALMRAEREQALPEDLAMRFNIGRNGNPVFGAVFRRPATGAGGTLAAAEAILDGGIAYNVAGGTHHGRRDRAAGFCYLNDPVLGLLRLRDAGLSPLLYVDLDAHHGDGVADAFAGAAEVVTLSIHDQGLWPRSGPFRADLEAGLVDLPVPPDFGDAELGHLIRELVRPLAETIEPQAIVIQGGADALADDPMSRSQLSNRALCQAVAALMPLAPRLLMLGGGGYNPWSVGRCWAGIWGVLNGHTPPARLPEPAEAVLRSLTWRHRLGRNPPERWMTSLADPPAARAVRPEIVEMAEAARRRLTSAARRRRIPA